MELDPVLQLCEDRCPADLNNPVAYDAHVIIHQYEIYLSGDFSALLIFALSPTCSSHILLFLQSFHLFRDSAFCICAFDLSFCVQCFVQVITEFHLAHFGLFL